MLAGEILFGRFYFFVKTKFLNLPRSDVHISELYNMNMNSEITKQLPSIKNGLLVLDKVFNKQKISYRVLGSVLVAALNGKPHRPLGDIDILFDESDIDKVKVAFMREGYDLILKSKFGIRWLEAHKLGSLGFTFLMVGIFGPRYFSYKLKSIELKILNDYLNPTNYSLLGTTFIGIPVRSIYEGLKISNLNPKRKLDNEVVKNYFKKHIPKGKSLEESFKVYFLGIEIPYAYPIFSYIYNLYGGLRVIFGKKYEIWD